MSRQFEVRRLFAAPLFERLVGRHAVALWEGTKASLRAKQEFRFVRDQPDALDGFFLVGMPVRQYLRGKTIRRSGFEGRELDRLGLRDSSFDDPYVFHRLFWARYDEFVQSAGMDGLRPFAQPAAAILALLPRDFLFASDASTAAAWLETVIAGGPTQGYGKQLTLWFHPTNLALGVLDSEATQIGSYAPLLCQEPAWRLVTVKALWSTIEIVLRALQRDMETGAFNDW